MGLKHFLSYIAVPAAIGALASFKFEDISWVDGARQMGVTGVLPTLIFSSEDKEKTPDFIEKRPYLAPILGAICVGATYALGGTAMKYLTGMDINQVFTGCVGAIMGGVNGALYLIKKELD